MNSKELHCSIGELPDQNMDPFEIQSICRDVGIAEDEMEQYKWLIDQWLEVSLPTGFIKEKDPSGQIYYLNLFDMEFQTSHPLISDFRTMFYSFLK